ncbi:MAG: FixH family protein [Hyphomonadaceae bacterium]
MNAAAGRVKGAHVLAALLAFFATVIAVNVAFVVFAVQSFPGEDVRRSYLQGLNYNVTIAERRAQAELGWRAVAVLSEQEGETVVAVVLRDAAGAPIDGLTAAGALRWPADERLDRGLVFEPRGQGRYVARVPDIAPGHWVLRARAEQDDGQALDFEAELTWPSSR